MSIRAFMSLFTACVVFMPFQSSGHAQNQTSDLSTIRTSGMPFRIEVTPYKATFDGLPGLHSGVACVIENGTPYILFFGGRSNTAGMHGFECGDGSFAKDDFNRTMYLVDSVSGQVWARSVDDPRSGLTIEQADQLSAVNYVENQIGSHVVCLGGYGYSRAVDDWVTFDTMALVEIDGVADWVRGGKGALSDSIRFLDPPEGAPAELYTTTGGRLIVIDDDQLWICLGQSFQGRYDPCDQDAAVQVYKRNVYRIGYEFDEAGDVSFTYLGDAPESGVEWANRRDLNILPAYVDADADRGAVALSGVFTPKTDGCWTLPLVINADGSMSQPDPDDPEALKQGFNIYSSAGMTAWSENTGTNWFIIGGGIGYEILDQGALTITGGFPYSSAFSAISYTPSSDVWAQYFANESYPRLPGGPTDESYWRFGTETYLFPVGEFWNEGRILELDAITEPTVVAFLYGGIMALGSDFGEPDFTTIASSHAFEITLIPGPGCPADFNGSGSVGGGDLAMLLHVWGELPLGATTPEDLNDDGWVNQIDLGMLISAWGRCP